MRPASSLYGNKAYYRKGEIMGKTLVAYFTASSGSEWKMEYSFRIISIKHFILFFIKQEQLVHGIWNRLWKKRIQRRNNTLAKIPYFMNITDIRNIILKINAKYKKRRTSFNSSMNQLYSLFWCKLLIRHLISDFINVNRECFKSTDKILFTYRIISVENDRKLIHADIPLVLQF